MTFGSEIYIIKEETVFADVWLAEYTRDKTMIMKKNKTNKSKKIKLSTALAVSFAIILGIAAVSFANTLQNNQNVRNKNLYKEPSANAYTGLASDKKEEDYTIAAPEENSNREWDISTEQRLRLTLGPYYSKDGKYAAPIIPVYAIQKTRSDTENIVIVICGEGYTESQQQKFIDDVKKVWNGAMRYEPYRSYADRFNVYALCTASESSFGSGGSTFFDVVVGSNNSSSISTNMGNPWKNHIFERCIGPAFIEQIHDAHIPDKTEPDTMYWEDSDQYPPFYYVHNYINQFALIVNTDRNFGDAYTNFPFGFHYFITPSDSYRAPQTFAHELGHGLLGLGDEYMDRVNEQTDITSLNVACNVNPEQVKWKKLLGFRKTYSCPSQSYGNAYNSSYECLMRDTDYPFCEVCRLQGYKRLSQLVDGKSLYVADPEVRKYTGRYCKPSDFADTTHKGYFDFAGYRSDALIGGADKNKFGTHMAGEEIELRTIVQNLSDVTERYVTMKVWIKRADGSIATAGDGSRLEATQTFNIPVWSEKSKFWPKGALGYDGSDFNSGLESCAMIYRIPPCAVLKNGDTIAFEVTDEKGNILADDNTETRVYANINIEYRFSDGSEIPNTRKSVIPVAVGSKLDWKAPPTLFGYTFAGATGHDQTVMHDGQTVTYYYTVKPNAHTHDWGDWASNGDDTHTRICRKDGSHTETANCSGGTATCGKKAVCSVCGAEYGDKLAHDWGEVKYTWTSDDTCTAERVCKRDKAHIESETVTAIGTEEKAATCKEKGKMKYTATFENAAFIMQEKEADADFAPHDYGTLMEEVSATCKDKGLKAHYKCSVCGKYFDENKKETSYEALQLPVSPYYGHRFDFWQEEVYATCQTTGRKGYKYCFVCKKNYDASNKEITDFVIPVNPDGHKLGELIAEIPATCKQPGVRAHRDCRLCKKHCDPITKKEIADLTIPATDNHTFGEWIDEIPATTEHPGTKGHKDCTVCGKHFGSDGIEITDLLIAVTKTHNVIINGENKMYAEGESVTVTAEDKEGKEFTGWKDANGKTVSTDKTYTFTVTGETKLTAVYKDNASGGETTPAPSKQVLSGGAIAGIAICSAAVLGLGGFAIFLFVVKGKSCADLIAAVKAFFAKKK